MPRIAHHALSSLRVRQEKRPGRYADGNGLTLHVAPSGSKFWLWRGTVNGERRTFALLRPVNGDATRQDRIRELVLQAYAEFERGATEES